MATTADRRKSTPSSPDVPGLWQSWRRHLVAEGKSPRTLEAYGIAFRSLADYLVRRGGSLAIGDLDRQDMDAWIVDLLDPDARKALGRQPLSRRTVRLYQSEVRIFLGWAVDEGMIAHSPMERVKLLRYDRTIHQVAPDVDLLTVIHAAAADRTKEGIRDTAILRLLFSGGMRRAECAGLYLADIDLDRRLARIRRGKGAKERVTTFDNETVKALDRYLRMSRPKFTGADDTDRLWVGRKGPLPGDGVPLGVVREAVERWSRATGVFVRPHDLRRAWASRLVDGGTPREYVMAAGGWDDEAMIAQYVAHDVAEKAIADIQRRMDGTAPESRRGSRR